MATSTAVPVEEYLSTTYHPDMEYVDGQLLERHVGEHYHSLTQNIVGAELRERGRDRGFRAFTEQRVRVSNEPKYRVPDLCVKALPYKVAAVLDHVDLAIEIVSPDDEPGDLLDKIEEYIGAGIPYVWVVDPYKRTLRELVDRVIRRATGTVLATPLVGEIDFAPIFEELYAPTE